MTEQHAMLNRVYALKSPGEAEKLYDDWAKDYDDEFGRTTGYRAPEHAVRALAGLLPERGAAVLDAGCGTGLVGAKLAQEGFTAIDGNDLSAAMLEQAEAKGVYRSLAKADLTARLDIADGAYGAVVCCGTLTEGHVGPAAMDELVRVAAPGAPVVITILERIWERDGYRAKAEALEQAGTARLESVSAEELYTSGDPTLVNVVVLRSA
ncbi:class I SAM-dependent DNA methyltransferase [Nocardiopsis coralliicola]